MELREYQVIDKDKMITHNCIGVFSEQRTGKTPPTCVSLKERNLYHTLIVCPASLVYVWAEQLKTWAGYDATVITTTGVKLNEIPANKPVIVNYEKLRGTSKATPILDEMLKWKPDAVIVDEAHRMKDRKSLTAKALGKFKKVPVRIALTGTPATNKPWDVWTILNWLFPNQYSSYWRFIQDYFEEETLWFGGEAHRQPARFKRGMEKILQQNLDITCIQRKRAEVMSWLPTEEEPTVVKLPLTYCQNNAINALETKFEYKHIVTQTILDNLIRIRQICAAPRILELKGGSPKADWLIDYLKDYPEKSVLVFSNSKKFLYYLTDTIDEKLKQQIPIICGDVSPRERLDIVKAFQSGKVKVLLCQTQACKEGLTLDTADVSIFMDVYPPSADYLQAKDRMVATTPERVKPKELIHVMMQDSYDEKVFSLVKDNIDETALINDYTNYINERRHANGKQ